MPKSAINVPPFPYAQLEPGLSAVQPDPWPLPDFSHMWTKEVFAAFNAKKLPPIEAEKRK